MSERAKVGLLGAGAVGALALWRVMAHGGDDVGRAALHAASFADDGLRVAAHSDELARTARTFDEPVRAVVSAEDEALRLAGNTDELPADGVDVADLVIEYAGDYEDEGEDDESPRLLEISETDLARGVRELAAARGRPLGRATVLDLHDGADLEGNRAALRSIHADPLIIAGRRQGDAIAGMREDELRSLCLSRSIRCVIVGTTRDEALTAATELVHQFEGATFDAMATALKDQQFAGATVSLAMPTDSHTVLVVRSRD